MSRAAVALVLLLAWPARADEPPPPPDAPPPAVEPAPADEAPPAVEAPPADAPPAAAAVTPPPLAALPPPPPPPRRRRWDLFAGGVVLFGVGYFTNIGLTYGFGFTSPGLSAIPLVGPFVQMANPYQLTGRPIDSGDPTFDRDTEKKIADGNRTLYQASVSFWALSAALQLGGAAMAILGVTLKHPPHGEKKKLTWQLLPLGTGAAARLTW